MPIPRFFVSLPLQCGATLALPDAVTHHALRVLRLAPGSEITLFNGKGGAWQATLAAQGKQGLAQITGFDSSDPELPAPVTLVQGIASGDKMDWIVEKSVELGAAVIAPIAAQRSVLRLSGDRLEKRLVHWQRIAQAACEQSGRNILPVVQAPVSLAQWLVSHAGKDLALLCHPDASQSLASALPQPPSTAPLALLVGPEGGWSDEELRLAEHHAVHRVRFGTRVLRTETAGVALLAATGALMGWQD